MRETRRPGRPPLTAGQKSVYVTVAISSKQYDYLDQQRKQQRLSCVPELIRRKLRHDDDSRFTLRRRGLALPARVGCFQRPVRPDQHGLEPRHFGRRKGQRSRHQGPKASDPHKL